MSLLLGTTSNYPHAMSLIASGQADLVVIEAWGGFTPHPWPDGVGGYEYTYEEDPPYSHVLIRAEQADLLKQEERLRRLDDYEGYALFLFEGSEEETLLVLRQIPEVQGA